MFSPGAMVIYTRDASASIQTVREREREREREIQKLVASVPFFSSSSSSSRYFDDDENSKNEIYRDYNFIVFMYCC